MQTCFQTLRHFGKNTLDKRCASTTSHQSIKDQRVPALHLLTFRLVETNLGDQPPPLAVIGVALWCCSSQNGAPQELQRKGRMGLSWNGEKMITCGVCDVVFKLNFVHNTSFPDSLVILWMIAVKSHCSKVVWSTIWCIAYLFVLCI